jgi:hypothetical protein
MQANSNPKIMTNSGRGKAPCPLHHLSFRFYSRPKRSCFEYSCTFERGGDHATQVRDKKRQADRLAFLLLFWKLDST